MEISSEANELANAKEFIKGISRVDLDKLFFVCLSRAPQDTDNIHFFTVDNTFVYTNFYADFGPSNMAHVVRFCYYMQDKFHVMIG